jgi:hypothetical protein
VSGASSFTASDAIDLLEWKHAIFDLYADIRRVVDPERAWRDWRATRDRMYRDHPQSPRSPSPRGRALRSASSTTTTRPGGRSP